MDYAYILLTLVCIYALLATSLNLIKGYGGMFSVAHAAFYGIGAYAFAIGRIELELPFLVALVLAFAVAGVASLIISIPSLRISGEYLLLATFAVQILATSLFLNLDITGGPAGIRNIPRTVLPGTDPGSNVGVFATCALLSLLCWLMMYEIGRSPFGRVLKAIREDEIGIAALGKNPLWFKIAVFFIGSGFAGVAGGLFATVITFINPDSFTIYASFTIVIMVLLGGLAHPFGGVLGAVVLTAIEEALRIAMPTAHGAHFAQLIFGITLVLIILFRPQGLLAEHATVSLGHGEDALKRRGRAEMNPVARTSATQTGEASAAMLKLVNVSKSYGGLQAVRSVSLEVGRGEIVGVVGPNGAGKTTLFDMIAGAVAPDDGQILLNGGHIAGSRPYQIARRGIGRLFQHVRPFANMTALENVVVAYPEVRRENPFLSWIPIDRQGERSRQEHAATLLDYIGLGGHAQERAGSLSFGQQKLTGFARLLAQGASVWLLDEPAAGIDPKMREDIRQVIRRVRDELGVTLLIVEHNMDFLEGLVDRVVFMAEGSVVRVGKIEEVLSDKELNRLYLGV